MIIKRHEGVVSVLGVQHSSRRDTSYVTSKIESHRFETGFVEKDPDVPLNEYGVQLRKIIGYLNKFNCNVIEFDDRLDCRFYEEETPDGFDEVTYNQNKSRFESVREMRQSVERNHPRVYQKIFLEREARMKQVIDNWTNKNELNDTVIILGESHVPPIHRYLDNKI